MQTVSELKLKIYNSVKPSEIYFPWCRAQVWSFNAKESGCVVIRRWVRVASAAAARRSIAGATGGAGPGHACRDRYWRGGGSIRAPRRHRTREQPVRLATPATSGELASAAAHTRASSHATPARDMSGARPRSAPLLLALAAAFLPQANHVAWVLPASTTIYQLIKCAPLT